MNDRPNQNDQDDLEGFETFEDDIQDDLPADDHISDADFQDVSDEVDADVFGDNEPAPVIKKKTNWFNIGVAVCAVLVAGGLVWSKLGPQLMGSVDQAQINVPADMTGEQLANTNAGDSQASIAQALQPLPSPDQSAANTGGVLDNPEGYADLAQMPAPDAPVPAKVEPNVVDPFAGLPAPVAAAPAPIESAVPMPAPIATAPMPEQTMPAPAMLAPVAATTVTTTVTTPAPVVPADTIAPAITGIEAENLAPVAAMPAVAAAPVAASADVTNKMNAMEARLDALDSKISQLQAPAADGRLDAIQATLQRLEGRLDDLSSKKTSVRSVSVESNDVSEPAPVKKAVKKSKPKAKAAPVKWDDAYVPPAARSASASGNGGWQLRGAKPGSAIIVKGNDIREVMVGDSVPGLGQISAVSNNSGRWMVQGSQGTLAQ